MEITGTAKYVAKSKRSYSCHLTNNLNTLNCIIIYTVLIRKHIFLAAFYNQPIELPQTGEASFELFGECGTLQPISMTQASGCENTTENAAVTLIHKEEELLIFYFRNINPHARMFSFPRLSERQLSVEEVCVLSTAFVLMSFQLFPVSFCHVCFSLCPFIHYFISHFFLCKLPLISNCHYLRLYIFTFFKFLCTITSTFSFLYFFTPTPPTPQTNCAY